MYFNPLTDHQCESPGTEVTTTIPAGASRIFTAAALESGGEGLEGSLGDGEGKWRLMIESAQPIVAMSLLSSPTDHLSNLSTAPVRDSLEGPDLTVASAAVSNNGPVAGATFTLSATVHNEGGAPSPVTVLRYYRSSDATITATDRAVGTDAVAELASIGERERFGGPDRAVDARDVLLRCVRGRGGAGVRYDKQLLDFRGGRCTGVGVRVGGATGPDGGVADGER